ncbi:Cac2 protein [Maudiozyma humilis]|uniref:Cac2 protein n=1 Tax=Maudiozyma humilis TaxID=51915 RepID=A0AAV5S7M2_MAUHU|nr:Cac2 protein [Kazachstania humilis]
MEASNLQIYWHESQPVYSLCFQENGNKFKLFTAGGDNKVRAWHLNTQASETEENCVRVETIDFLSSLQQHEQAVNVVRFNNCAPRNTLATAGDDGQVLLWRQNDTIVREFGMDDAEASEVKESWYVHKRLRYSSNSEIYDLCWSPDDRYIIVGCMDNCMRIFDVESERCIVNVKDHNHYVQGVAWDPLNKYVFSQSADRSMHIYRLIFASDDPKRLESVKLRNRIVRTDLPSRRAGCKPLNFDVTKTANLFHNETLPSFFRRLTVSPCGSILCVPAGIYRTEAKSTASESGTPDPSDTTSGSDNNATEYCNAVHMYTRGAFNQDKMPHRPVVSLPFLKKPAIVVSFNPQLYEKQLSKSEFLDLPHRLIFAVATSNEVLIYDLEHAEPLSVIGNMHYTPLTDLAWSADGTLLMVSSTDGFCSYVSLDPELLGKVKPFEIMAEPEVSAAKVEHKASAVISSTPAPATDTKPVKKAFDIVNVLPVKRKLPSQTAQEPTAERTPEKAKRRVQPTLLDVGVKDTNENKV